MSESIGSNHDLNSILPYKRENSTSRRRSTSASLDINSQNDDSNFASSAILTTRSDPFPHTTEHIEHLPLSDNSQTSTKINLDHTDYRFGGHQPNNEEEEDDSHHNIDEEDDDEEVTSDNINQQNKNDDDSLRTPLQRKFYYFFQEPVSNWARAFEAFSALCTIITITILCVITWPTFYRREKEIYYRYLLPFDIVCLVTFTVEYVGRFYASVNKWKFFFKPINLIDLISIIPFYIQFIIHAESLLKFIRVLRLFKILRLFHIAKYNAGFNITKKVFRRSAYQIVMIFVYVLIIVLASSALMFYMERGEFHKDNDTWYRFGVDGTLEKSPFQSIVHSFWWSMVTLTTTGYGDIVPVTGPGKLIAALTMTCGILVIAIPTSIIGSNFNNEWAFHRRLRFQLKIKQAQESIPKVTDKSRKIELLQDQNQTMLEALSEIQDRLADINPPRYYQKYKKLEIKHLETLKKISELEDKLNKWKKRAQNLETFNKTVRKGDTDLNNDIAYGKSGWRWKLSSQKNLGRYASETEADYRDKHKFSPFKTLTKIGRSLTASKRSKLSEITKEAISPPKELRHSFTPIVNSKEEDNTKSVNDNGDAKDKAEKELSDNIEVEDNQEKNSKSLISRNKQSTETEDIEIVVDDQK